MGHQDRYVASAVGKSCVESFYRPIPNLLVAPEEILHGKWLLYGYAATQILSS
jgi:hypothetical protein